MAPPPSVPSEGDVDETEIISPQDLEELYLWIDCVPLSRPKRILARDFSDGVCVAEIVHHYTPRLIEIHNYVSANNLNQKRVNWGMLNRKVFFKLNMKITDRDIENVIEAKAGAIEQVLWDLRKKLIEANPKAAIVTKPAPSGIPPNRSPSMCSYAGGARVPTKASQLDTKIPVKNSQKRSTTPTGKPVVVEGISYCAELKEEMRKVSPAIQQGQTENSDDNANVDLASLPPPQVIFKGHKMVPLALVEIKGRQIKELEATVVQLSKKLAYQENLNQVKETRLEDLSRQLHGLRSRLGDKGTIDTNFTSYLME